MRNPTPMIAAATLLLAAGSALAHQPQRERQQAREAERTVLRGPQVDAQTQDAGRPDKEGDEAMSPRRVELPFSVYVAHLRSLERGEDESLRLSPEQAQQVRTLAQEHREAIREFMEEHRETIRELRQISGERAEGWQNQRPNQERPNQNRPNQRRDADNENRPQRDADRPQRVRDREQTRDTMQPADREQRRQAGETYTPEQRAEARDKLHALMASAPGDKAMREKLMGVLTDAQRERVEAAIAARIRMQQAGEGEGRPDARPGQRPAARPGQRPDAQPAQRPAQRERRPGRDGG